MAGQFSIDLDDIFNQEGLLTVAYGMGTNSTAMLCEMVRRGIRPDCITFADTGGEWPHTYAYLDVINAYLAKHGFPTVIVVRYRPQKFKNKPYSTLEGNCLSNKTLPSLAFGYKSCSIKWKASPQEKFLTKEWKPGVNAVASGVPMRRWIGYDAGPRDSQRGAVNPNPKFRYAYPLQVWGMDREACVASIDRAGLPQPLKSACFFCPSTKPHELLDLVWRHPELAKRALAIENNARQNLRTIEGLWRKGTRTKPGSWLQFFKDHDLLKTIEAT